VKRRDEEPPEPGGHAEKRRRQFEESRGLGARRDLDLDDEHEDQPPNEKPPAADEEVEP